MLREGLEASLIVGILLAYLSAIGRRDRARSVWAGVAAAVAGSVAAGAVLFFTASEFEGRAEQIFEGLTALTAVGVLTWMIFWMRRHAIDFKRNLQAKISVALASPRRTGLAAIAAVVVLREGIETSLFLFATVRQVGPGPGTIGGALGLLAAIALGLAIYKGGLRLNLSTFFTVTGAFLLIVAAGLAARGAHELIEARLIPPVVERLWSWHGLLADTRGPGAFLHQLFGYNSAPALSELMVWTTYLLIAGITFFRPVIRLRRSTAAAPQSAQA
jgi:high-affinity iron transporter